MYVRPETKKTYEDSTDFEVEMKKNPNLPYGHPHRDGFDFNYPNLPPFLNLDELRAKYDDEGNPPPFVEKDNGDYPVGYRFGSNRDFAKMCEDESAFHDPNAMGSVGDAFLFKWGGSFVFRGAKVGGHWIVLFKDNEWDTRHAYASTTPDIPHHFLIDGRCGCGKVPMLPKDRPKETAAQEQKKIAKADKAKLKNLEKKTAKMNAERLTKKELHERVEKAQK